MSIGLIIMQRHAAINYEQARAAMDLYEAYNLYVTKIAGLYPWSRHSAAGLKEADQRMLRLLRDDAISLQTNAAALSAAERDERISK